MINIHNADSILGVTMVGDLFTNNSNIIDAEYKDLAKIWHPDNNKDPKASDVFAHIGELYQKALDLLSAGKWEKKNYIQLQKKDGKKIDINYLRKQPFELGTTYICNRHIIYVFDNEHKLFYDNALSNISNFKFANENMEKEISRFLPSIFTLYETVDNKYCYVINKTEDVYSLIDVLNYYNGNIPDRHVAWIMTRLNNLLCYLDYSGLSHNGININNCFISPEYHSIMLYGGWWYTRKQGEKLIGTSKEIFDVMPLSIKSTKNASIITDLESVKLIGRTLLGDRIGTQLQNKGVPASFASWLCNGSSKSALEEAKKWDNALQKSYGQRKFIKMDILKNQIYKL